MNIIRYIFSVIASALVLSLALGCQSQPKSPVVILDVRVLDTVKWEMTMLQDAGSYCRTTVPVEVVAPEKFRSLKLNLVLQVGMSDEREDWIEEGYLWRPIGTCITVHTTEMAIADDEVHAELTK